MEIIPPYLRIYQQILKDLENAFPLSLRTIFLLLFAHHTFPLTLLLVDVGLIGKEEVKTEEIANIIWKSLS